MARINETPTDVDVIEKAYELQLINLFNMLCISYDEAPVDVPAVRANADMRFTRGLHRLREARKAATDIVIGDLDAT